jgi:hypothetical protein
MSIDRLIKLFNLNVSFSFSFLGDNWIIVYIILYFSSIKIGIGLNEGGEKGLEESLLLVPSNR